MRSPIRYRKHIPFFHDKSKVEFQKDDYERYDPTVIRQSALHFCDHLWGTYPFQTVLDFADQHLPSKMNNILEVGCGVGRWIAELSQKYPKAQCWGIDFSYQMLKQASAFWKNDQPLTLNLANKGFQAPISLDGHKIPNLQFGLAKADALPFADESQDLLVHSFLIDRLPNIKEAILEFHRVLVPDGIMCFVSPLNFNHAKQWSDFYPPEKLYQWLNNSFEIIEKKEKITIIEPLDYHGNHIQWNCVGVVAKKKN